MRTENIVYSTVAPGTPETFTGTLGTYTINTANHNLTGNSGSMRVWTNGSSPTASPSVTLVGSSYINGGSGGTIQLNLDAIDPLLSAADPTETVWHYSLFITHLGNQVHVCSGYLIRIVK
jgi:hypothetical protein